MLAILVSLLVVGVTAAFVWWKFLRRVDSRPIRDVNPAGGIIFDTVPEFEFGEPLNVFVRLGEKAGQEFHNSRTEKTAHYPGVEKAMGTAHFRQWFQAMLYLNRNPDIEDADKLKRHIDNLSYKKQFYLNTLVQHLAHCYRMGSPELPIPRGEDPIMHGENAGADFALPTFLAEAQMYLAKKLKVPHSFTLFTWIWSNWQHKRLKPGEKFTNKDILNPDDIVYKYRFFPGMETERNFWLAWFMTEAHAAKLYPLMIKAIECTRSKRESPEEAKKRAAMAKSVLMRFEPLVTNAFDQFAKFITFEKTKVDEWQDIQGALHWHDELTPGISGYQEPLFLALDAFFMTPLPQVIRQSKQKNTVCQPYHIQRFITRLELQRMAVFKFAQRTKDKEISKTFSSILRKLMIFRSRHLAQCRPYLRRATTTARNFHESAGGSVSAKKAQDMGQKFDDSTNTKMEDGEGPFAEEMNQLIKATKSCKAFKEGVEGSLSNQLSVGAVTVSEDRQMQDHLSANTTVKKKKFNRFSMAASEARQELLTLQNTWEKKLPTKKEDRRMSASMLL